MQTTVAFLHLQQCFQLVMVFQPKRILKKTTRPHKKIKIKKRLIYVQTAKQTPNPSTYFLLDKAIHQNQNLPIGRETTQSGNADLHRTTYLPHK